MRRLGMGLLLALLWLPLLGWPARPAVQEPPRVFPAPAEQKSTTPFPGITLLHERHEEPRPLNVWIVRIDLEHPDVDFVVTPRSDVKRPAVTLSETTLTFARRMQARLAVNASPFKPVAVLPGQPTQIEGLSLAMGDLYSPPVKDFGVVAIDRLRRVHILPPPVHEEQLEGYCHGVGGFAMLINDGKNLHLGDNPHDVKHPRTAIGLTRNRRTMIWIVVDGRQPGKSEGVTMRELAQIGLQQGCHQLLNMDGGGSTTLVKQDDDLRDWHVVNLPVGQRLPGSLRPNGNHLGVRVFLEQDSVTTAQLRAIMPQLSNPRCRQFIGPLNDAMREFDINTPRRRAAFLAQLAHESGELRYLEEIASGEAYVGRKDLGNTEPGDGVRFKGRGPIQLTGRANYRRAGQALGLNLEAQPALAADPCIGCRVAGWFWKQHKLNERADQEDFTAITRVINGGLRGQAQRQAYYERAKEVLKVK